jgi:hypothetical protein
VAVLVQDVVVVLLSLLGASVLRESLIPLLPGLKASAPLRDDLHLLVTCYQPDEDGRACGACDACRIRKAGFADAGIADTTRYRR